LIIKPHKSSLEDQLSGMKSLYKKGLIPEGIYLKKVSELMSLCFFNQRFKDLYIQQEELSSKVP